MVSRGTALSELKIWKTIKRGNHTSADASRVALKAAGINHWCWNDHILRRANFGSQETELNLVVVSAIDLYPKGATIQQIYRQAIELGHRLGITRQSICEQALDHGLEKVPHWGGPALREEYKDQPDHEWLYMGMDPIADSQGLLRVFTVGRFGEDLRLDAGDDYPIGGFSDSRWVFVLPINRLIKGRDTEESS